MKQYRGALESSPRFLSRPQPRDQPVSHAGETQALCPSLQRPLLWPCGPLAWWPTPRVCRCRSVVQTTPPWRGPPRLLGVAAQHLGSHHLGLSGVTSPCTFVRKRRCLFLGVSAGERGFWAPPQPRLAVQETEAVPGLRALARPRQCGRCEPSGFPRVVAGVTRAVPTRVRGHGTVVSAPWSRLPMRVAEALPWRVCRRRPFCARPAGTARLRLRRRCLCSPGAAAPPRRAASFWV